MKYKEYAQFEFGKNLRYLVSKIDEIEKEYLKSKKINISQRELDYIALIALNPGVSFTDLIALESVSKSTFSNQVKTLEAKGYVAYKPLGDSKKAKTLVLTDKGNIIFKEYETIRVHFFEKYVSPHFTDKELSEIAVPTAKLIEVLKKQM